VVALAAAALLAVAPAALAKGASPNGGSGGGGKGGGGSSSLSLVMVTDANGNGTPNWGDTVTFKVTTTQTQYPSVALKCSQGKTLVYQTSAGFYPSYPWPWQQNMTLKSDAWTGGAADCTATLNTSLATLTFHVDA
jgi:hypothetical protein